MLTVTRLCRCIFFIALCLPMTVHANKTIQSMIVFGDSLSDTGNTTHLLKSLRQDESPAFLVRPLKVFVINKMTEYANDYYVPQAVLDAGIGMVSNYFDTELAPLLTSIIGKIRLIPVLPGKPYWQNHFSNGRVWSEYLAPMLSIDREDLSFFSNQAFAGSWAVSYDYQLTVWNLIRHPIGTLKTLIVGKLIPPSLGITVQAYLLMYQSLDEQAAYFVFTGGNDYINVLAFEDNYNPAVMSAYIDNVLNGIASGVRKLTTAGARHVVIMGIPDVGLTPKFARTSDKTVLSDAVKLHNKRLAALVETWRQAAPAVDFLFIDVDKLLQNTLGNASNYGFTNVSDACIDVKFPMFDAFATSPFANNFILQYAQVLQYRDANFAPGERNYNLCDTPQNYLFWDEVHPTTRAHQYLAYDICEILKANGYQADCQKPSNI